MIAISNERIDCTQPYPRLQRKAFWAKKLSILKAKKRPEEALFGFLECCFFAQNLVVNRAYRQAGSWKKVQKITNE
ncbi:MAG TPA: hypothetical protein PLL09_15250 [Flavobacterium sp.]|uniref:hypothetical protein n=1 Tax=unclassified Flavobacterium TaxID=196869 RepID=UPI000E870FC2|nr:MULTISPECIES: hypothetical protein [unclassified Flavobacterium]HBI01895.1 hypothetical protein [Flavobacterium sp.]HRE79172.1 hypothetical protein [Flavobacterium sp.]